MHDTQVEICVDLNHETQSQNREQNRKLPIVQGLVKAVLELPARHGGVLVKLDQVENSWESSKTGDTRKENPVFIKILAKTKGFNVFTNKIMYYH